MPNDRKLGRKAVKTDTRTLRLERYFTAALPAPPAARNWSNGVINWGMLLNDTLGDCTIAGVGHAVQAFSVNTGREAVVGDAEVLSYYEAWDGYRPADPNSDQGGICLDVLTSWRKYEFCGHRLLAFATVLPANAQHVQQAINLFGGAYIGLNVPAFIMADSPDIPELWDVAAEDGGIAGGHCVFVVGYDAETVTFVSWGSLYRMTWAFWDKYVDEAYALISPDWIGTKGDAPNGFALAALESDLVEVTN
jgi:hypothetical protein